MTLPDLYLVVLLVIAVFKRTFEVRPVIPIKSCVVRFDDKLYVHSSNPETTVRDFNYVFGPTHILFCHVDV